MDAKAKLEEQRKGVEKKHGELTRERESLAEQRAVLDRKLSDNQVGLIRLQGENQALTTAIESLGVEKKIPSKKK